ncbi:hypothetical protein ED21_24666 [Erythrobacter sp. SD-21]|nr:hypothetical protein ED21_24666 [Erythrobacter sp. SD-21]
MDLCFIAGILILASFLPIFDNLVSSGGSIPVWYRIYGAVLIFFTFFITPILILARFMRDEYAEQLFRRTTDVVVYAAIAMPLLVFWAATLVYLVTRSDEAPYPFSLFMVEVTWWSAVSDLFKYFCLLFVFVF